MFGECYSSQDWRPPSTSRRAGWRPTPAPRRLEATEREVWHVCDVLLGPGNPRAARHPPQPVSGPAARRLPASGIRAGTRCARRARTLRTSERATSSTRPCGRRLSATPSWIHPSPWRPGCSTTTPTPKDLPRLCRRAAFRRPGPGQHRRQHHAVLAHRYRGLGGPVVLGKRASPGPHGRAATTAGQAPGRLHHIPGRDLPGPPQLGRGVLPHPHLFQRGRPGRPLRRLGRARRVHDRGSGGVQAATLTTGRRWVQDLRPDMTPAADTNRPGR